MEVKERVYRVHDVTDSAAVLVDVQDTGVCEFLAVNEREEVVVEGHQEPVVPTGVGELFTVWIAERVGLDRRRAGGAPRSGDPRGRRSERESSVQEVRFFVLHCCRFGENRL